MKQVKKTKAYRVLEKRSGRYAVKNRKGRLVSGDAKTEILLAEGLVKRSEPRPAEPEPEADAAETEGQKTEAGEAAAEG